MAKYKGKTAPYKISSRIYFMPVTHCVFCKFCSDILYDYTHGPYMFFCDKQLEPDITEESCECASFEHSGYDFDDEEEKIFDD